MLRVGLTGGLGSGKSTVGRMLAGHGATVLAADEIGRRLTEPGQPAFAAIVRQFGSGIVRSDGTLDRAELARLAFAGGRLEELNALVHPTVIQWQAAFAEELARREPGAILVVESALLFETRHAGPEGWRSRFDRVVLVAATEAEQVERYVRRVAEQGAAPVEESLRETARARLRAQLPEAQKRAWADFVIENNGTLEQLREAVARLWAVLRVEAGWAGAD